MGPREGLLILILGTPLRFLMPFVLFGLAGYSYIYLKNTGRNQRSSSITNI